MCRKWVGQPGSVDPNFALQSSALIPIGSFVRIIKMDWDATGCIHLGGVDAKPSPPQTNVYSLLLPKYGPKTIGLWRVFSEKVA